MRIMLTSYPERSHFLVMAPLAWALRTAGHDVRVVVQPGFVEHVTRAGLTGVAAGPDRDLWQVIGRRRGSGADPGSPPAAATAPVFDGPGLPAPYDVVLAEDPDRPLADFVAGYRRVVSGWHRLSNTPMVGSLVDFARAWRPDLVLWEPVTFAGAIAARACGAAHGRILVGTDVTGATRERFLRARAAAGVDPDDLSADPLGSWLHGYATRYGGEFGEDMVTGQFTVDQLPPGLGLATAQPRVACRHVPYGGPAIVPSWLAAASGRRRVAVTTGLTLRDRGLALPVDLGGILRELSRLDVEVVATVGDQQRRRLPDLAGNVRLVRSVPLPALLPTCDAVVHLAGIGTLATAAGHAVPQLAIAWDNDGPVMARGLQAAGAGLHLRLDAADPDTVRDHVARLLEEPGFAQGAARLRTAMERLPPPGRAVDDIERRTTTQ